MTSDLSGGAARSHWSRMPRHPTPPSPPGCSRSIWSLVSLLISLALVPLAEAARGRPSVNAAGTTLVTDSGTLIRGAIISTETGVLPSLSAVQRIKTLGLNAIHCYAERADYGYSAGRHAAALDRVVEMTRDNDLYLVITIGGGGVNRAFIDAFWTFYAPRYANEPHVIYEIQNEPVVRAPVSSSVIDMEMSAYGIIRDAAPDTPVLFMSYTIFQNASGVLADMVALGPEVDWTKAAVSFHGYGEQGPAATRACLEAVIAAGYPCFQTEFYRWPWGTGDFDLVEPPSLYQDVDQTGDLERLGVSWLTFLSIGRVADDTRFKSRLENAGVYWSPDYGEWPSATDAPRAPFGNDGEPRDIRSTAATRIQAEDYDVGGEGTSYHDTSAGNAGNRYRTDQDVDIETATDDGGGHNVGWIATGEWLDYTVFVRNPGRYAVSVRVAAPAATGLLRLRLAGVDITGEWTVPATGGYQAWTTLSKTVDLTPGRQVLRFESVRSSFNLNWIEFTPVAAGEVPNGTYKLVNRHSGKSLDVTDASTANGAKLQQWGYGGGANQRWVLTHRGANQYTITSAHTGKGIDVAAGNILGGDHLQMYTASSSSANQRWLVQPADDGYHRLISVYTGLAMEVPGASTASGARVESWEYFGGAEQQWAVLSPVAVTIAATDAELGGIATNTAAFTVTRDYVGSGALTVNLAAGGTAEAGREFTMPATVTIPAGQARASVVVSPVAGRLPETDRELTVSVLAGTGYGPGITSTAGAAFAARDAFAQWIADHLESAQQADSALAAPLAAPFGDGVTNLARAAFDLAPGPVATPPVTAATNAAGEYLEINYARLAGGVGTGGADYAAGGIRYAVEVAGDLAGPWLSGPDHVELLGAPRPSLDGRLEWVTMRPKKPLAETPRVFMRLRLSLAGE